LIPNGGPGFVTLWRSDGSGLRMYTDMHDVAERREVGVLNFERVFAPHPDEFVESMEATFGGEAEVSKLIIHESGTSAESGVILKAQTGEELVVVAASAPYSLALQGLKLSRPHIFQPEYPLNRYDRLPVT
jgi:hypothetical protein